MPLSIGCGYSLANWPSAERRTFPCQPRRQPPSRPVPHPIPRSRNSRHLRRAPDYSHPRIPASSSAEAFEETASAALAARFPFPAKQLFPPAGVRRCFPLNSDFPVSRLLGLQPIAEAFCLRWNKAHRRAWGRGRKVPADRWSGLGKERCTPAEAERIGKIPHRQSDSAMHPRARRQHVSSPVQGSFCGSSLTRTAVWRRRFPGNQVRPPHTQQTN